MQWVWTERRERAALLVVQDRQSDDAIASAVGVKRWTLEHWKRQPEFKARVAEHAAALAAAIRDRGIAERVNRVDALNERWDLLRQVIKARAADETMKGAGYATGLLVRTYKQNRTRLVEEYAVDTGLLAELRAHEKQAAQELGQWTEKREHTGKDGGPVQIEVRAVDYRQAAAALRPPPAAGPEVIEAE